MAISSNPQRGRESLFELLDWIGSRVVAAREAVAEMDDGSELFLRMDAVWAGQVWFDKGEEDDHLLALFRGLLKCSAPRDALDRYLEAKAEESQADFSEFLRDVSTPEDLR